jgi:hypothetical protein
MPLPLFYGPLPFWAMAPAALAGAGTAALVSSSFVAAGAVGALSAWLAGAAWSGDRRVALVAATAWSFAPYRLLVSGFRASLGEAWALALTPLLLVAFDRALVRRGARPFAFAALSLALLALAHPLSLALAVIVLTVFALVRVATLEEPLAARGARLLRGAGAALAGLALAGFFVLPLALEQRHLDLHGIRGEAGRHRYEGHFVRPGQWLVRELWDRATWSQHPRLEPKLRDMPFYVGLALLGGLAGAALVGRGRRGAGDPPRLALAATGAVSLTLMVEPAARLGAEVPLLAALQFPWRFLGPASAAAALAAATLVPVGRGRRAWAAAAAVAVALLADGFPYAGAVGRVEPWSGLAKLGSNRHATGRVHAPRIPEPWPHRVKGSMLPPPRCCFDVAETWWVFPEYFTPAARRTVDVSVRSSTGLVGYDELRRVDAWPYARLWRRGRRAPRALPYRRGGGRIEVTVPPGARGRIEVAEQHFPGWQVEIEGRWRDVAPSADGFLEAPVPGKGGRLHFRFDRWRDDRLAGWILSAATGLLLAFACARTPRPDA